MSMFWIEFGHVVIAMAYFALSIVTVALVRLPRDWETIMARVGGGSFFLGCGLHHIDFMAHSSDGDQVDYLAFHHWFPEIMQVVGAPLFLLAILPYLGTIAAVLRVPKRDPNGDRDEHLPPS